MSKYQMVKLDDVCEKASSSIAQKDIEMNNGAYPIYGASGKIKNIDFYKQKEEYIAIVKDGAGIGRTMLLPAYSSIIGTMQYILPKETISIKYLYYAITSMNLAKYFSGATIPHIYFRDYKNEILPLPNKEKQNEIVCILDKIVGLIRRRENQLSKIDELAKSRFLEMFGNVKSSKKISHFVDSNIVSAKKAYDENTTIKYIDISSVDNKSFSIETITEYCFKDAPSRAQQCVISGDILVSTVRPNLKNIAVVESTDKNLVASSGFCVLRAVKCPKEFLFGIISSDDFTNAMVGLTTGANYPAIKDSDILKYPVPDTSSTNMEFYANFIQQLDKSKFRIKKSLEKLELTYKALLQEYFG